MVKRFGFWEKLAASTHIHVCPPLGYLDFLQLLSTSNFALTDSGGVQEEAVTLKIPCLTMRKSTERPETVTCGANIVVGANRKSIVYNARRLIEDRRTVERMKSAKNPLGDGKAGRRIARISVDKCRHGIEIESPCYYETGSASFKLLRAGGKLEGKTVKKLQHENPNLMVTAVYDEEGKPLFPHPDTRLRKNWALRVFGQWLPAAGVWRPNWRLK